MYENLEPIYTGVVTVITQLFYIGKIITGSGFSFDSANIKKKYITLCGNIFFFYAVVLNECPQ